MPSSTLESVNPNLVHDASDHKLMEYLESIEPSMMPTTVRTGDDSLEKIPLPVQIDNFKNIEKVAQDLGISAESFFRGAWALVLRRYLSINDICFAVSRSRVGDDAIPGPSQLLLSSYTLNDKTTIREFLQKGETNHFSNARNLRHEVWLTQIRDICNTIIVFNELSDDNLKHCDMGKDVSANT